MIAEKPKDAIYSTDEVIATQRGCHEMQMLGTTILINVYSIFNTGKRTIKASSVFSKITSLPVVNL